MRRAAAVAAVIVGLLGACSDSASDAPSTLASSTSAVSTTTSPPASTSTDATTTTVAPTTAAATSTVPDYSQAAWSRVDAPANCMCSDGSAYSYWVRVADPTKVVFFLQGGGACFSAETCAFDSGTYKVNVGADDDASTFSAGIWNFADTRNPFADYSFVFAPYCTGDLHLGNATRDYAPDLTVHHNGSTNATTALADLATRFPNARDVVVTGESAGSAPTPLYAGLVHDLLPDADITVLADGSGAYPDSPGINAAIGQLWGARDALPAWPEAAGLTLDDWSLPELFVRAYQHDPDILFARHDYAYDGVQQFFADLSGVPADDLVSLIDGNEVAIEQAGVDLRSYISPGERHTVLSQPTFYTEVTEGVALVDWVADLVRRRPDLDVHCTDCRT